jgi:hypothetical protein
MEFTMEQKANVSFCVKLQKSPSEKLEMIKTVYVSPQAKEAMDVKVQDQNNVDLLFRLQGHHPL